MFSHLFHRETNLFDEKVLRCTSFDLDSSIVFDENMMEDSDWNNEVDVDQNEEEDQSDEEMSENKKGKKSLNSSVLKESIEDHTTSNNMDDVDDDSDERSKKKEKGKQLKKTKRMKLKDLDKDLYTLNKIYRGEVDCKIEGKKKLNYFYSKEEVHSKICSNVQFVKRFKRSRICHAHDGCVNTLKFNQTGDLLISGSDDCYVKIWKPRELQYFENMEQNEEDNSTPISLFNDESDTSDNEYLNAIKSDASNLPLLQAIDTGHSGNIFCALFLPYTGDREIITCAADGQIRYFDIEYSGSLSNGETYKQNRQSSSFQSSENNTFSFNNRNNKVNNPQYKYNCKRVYKCHGDMVHKMSLLGSSHSFLSCSNDCTVRLFDLRSDLKGESAILVDLRRTTSSEKGIEVNSIDINPVNMNYFTIGCNDPYVRIYDIRKPNQYIIKHCPNRIKYKHEKPRKQFNAPIHITGVRYSNDANMVIASYSGEYIYGLHLKSNFTESKYFDIPPMNQTPSNNTTLKEQTFEMKTNLPNISQYKGHLNVKTVKEVNFMGFNSEYIISGSDCGNVFVWERDTCKLVNVLRGDRNVVNCVTPNPQNPLMLATSGLENDVKIFEPLLESAVDLKQDKNRQEEVLDIIKKNKKKLKDGSNFISLPASILFDLLDIVRNEETESNSGEESQENREGEENRRNTTRRQRLRRRLRSLSNDENTTNEEDSESCEIQ